ncbi:hypothetical protein [Chryseobacterium carnipullorum]|nr:hypothetical protein [Chryseobacterium carnipullorum]
MEKDKNFHTERIYKAGYKLSEISNQLKISEIKSLFEVKKAVMEVQRNADNLKVFRENLRQKGFSLKIQYNGDFKAGQKNEIQDIWINKVDSNQQKNGFFFRKNVGFSLSAIDSDLGDLGKLLSQSSVNNDAGNLLKTEKNESLIEIAGGLLGDFLNPTYVSQEEEELWKKKRKIKR